MTEKTKTKAALMETIELRGVVKFANLLTPMGYDANTNTFSEHAEKLTYGLTLLVKADDDQLHTLMALNNRAIEAERARITKDKQLKVKDQHIEMPEDTDKEGNATGMTIVRTKRNGKFDPPIVVDRKGQVVEKDRLKYGTEVRIKVKAYSYNVANKVGLSLGLDEVQIISEPEHTKMPTFKSLDDDLSDMNLEESPF